jgi:membrane associated rhomboid family serine protease
MAFFQPPAERQPMFNAPTSVVVLVVALVAIHAGLNAFAVPDAAIDPYLLVPARYAQGGPLWTLVAPLIGHMFLHVNYYHVLANAFFLLAFGAVVARRLGTPLFLAFYLLCGLAAAATSIGLDWGSTIPRLGASGAVAGLMAAGFRLMRWRKSDPADALLPLWSAPILKVSAVWLIANVLLSFTSFGLVPEGNFADWHAHMGGYVFGLLTIGLFDRLRRVPVTPAD